MEGFLPEYFLCSYNNFRRQLPLKYPNYFGDNIDDYSQIGGSQQSFKYKYIDINGINTFIMREIVRKNSISIAIMKDNYKECVLVEIIKNKKNNKEAILQSVGYYKECTKEGLVHPGGGSILLRFILNYLFRYKNKYEIKRILLTDNSHKDCLYCGHRIKLSRLMMITKGKTWYMNYGFLPYNMELGIPHKKLLKYLKQDQNNINNLIVGKKDIITIAKVAIKENDLDNNLLNDIDRIASEFEYFRDFIKRLNLEYNKYCCIIGYLLRKLYESKRPILTDFFGKVFYLDI